jgi:Malectin domain
MPCVVASPAISPNLLASNATPAGVYSTSIVGHTLTSNANLTAGLIPGETYSVSLHFLESQFNATGQRMFDVLVNGVPGSCRGRVCKSAQHIVMLFVAVFRSLSLHLVHVVVSALCKHV